MNRFLCGITAVGITAVGITAVGIAAFVPAAQAQTSDEDAIRAVITAIAAYSQAKDLGAMDTLFAAGRGVHIIEGAGVNHGWEDYRDNHLGRELDEFENFQYRYYAVEPEVRVDMAWASFRYDLAVDTPRGHVEREGRGSAVLEKRDGRWLIVHLHTSGRPKRNQ